MSLFTSSHLRFPGARSCTSSASGTCVQVEEPDPSTNPLCHATPIQSALRLKQVISPISACCLCDRQQTTCRDMNRPLAVLAFACTPRLAGSISKCIKESWWAPESQLMRCEHACAGSQQHGMGCVERKRPHPHPRGHAHPCIYCAAIQDLPEVMRWLRRS